MNIPKSQLTTGLEGLIQRTIREAVAAVYPLVNDAGKTALRAVGLAPEPKTYLEKPEVDGAVQVWCARECLAPHWYWVVNADQFGPMPTCPLPDGDHTVWSARVPTARHEDGKFLHQDHCLFCRDGLEVTDPDAVWLCQPCAFTHFGWDGCTPTVSVEAKVLGPSK